MLIRVQSTEKKLEQLNKLQLINVNYQIFLNLWITPQMLLLHKYE